MFLLTYLFLLNPLTPRAERQSARMSKITNDGLTRNSAWRAEIRRVWGLPRTAHNNLLPLISCQPPLSDVIAKRFISYVQRYLTSDCDIVNYIVQYGIWFGRMASPVGCSVQHCCNK